MKELKTLGQEFFGHAGFPSLERLLLERLPKLECCLVDNDQVLHNLRHFSVAGCPRLRSYPTHPRTLNHIAILDEEHIQCKLYIGSLNLLSSFCCVVSSSIHALHAHHLEFVEDLAIYVNSLVDTSTAVFNNLKTLKRLNIYGIHRANTCSVITTLWDENGGTVLPSSLRCLQLQRCYLQPSSFSKFLNNLSSLETLHLADCDTVETPGPPVRLHHLRMLKQLDIYKCDWISSFEGSEALLSLEEMKIDQCYDLESVPHVDGIPSLQKLHLSHCPQVMRLSKAGHQTTLKELVVRSCSSLSSLQQLCDLVSLLILSVTDCSDLLWLPDMDGFYSFRDVKIVRCPRLMSLPRSGLPVSLETIFLSLPRSGLPVSLETIFLSECHQALQEQFQRKEGPDWKKVAALPGCKWKPSRW